MNTSVAVEKSITSFNRRVMQASDNYSATTYTARGPSLRGVASPYPICTGCELERIKKAASANACRSP